MVALELVFSWSPGFLLELGISLAAEVSALSGNLALEQPPDGLSSLPPASSLSPCRGPGCWLSCLADEIPMVGKTD